MGDRAMAQIKTSEGDLFFYTHNTGSELPRDAREAVALATKRKGDDAYVLKIVVDSLIKNARARDSETGAGLMFRPNAEDEYNDDEPSVVIDLSTMSVEVFGH